MQMDFLFIHLATDRHWVFFPFLASNNILCSFCIHFCVGMFSFLLDIMPGSGLGGSHVNNSIV